ncbi:MAG: hypothetical protein M1833_002762 [Piccolia ochrophora]|nr:MAG: hypothetical protein M1833_002762 [Piccolia ochrophora]
MQVIKVSLIFILLCLLEAAHGHTLFTNFFVDGTNQGDGVCVREPTDRSNANNPIPNIDGQEMACGVNGKTGVARVCPVDGGSKVTIEWRSQPENVNAGFIASSHKGPCAVYMKKVDSAIEDTGAGNGWFKIFEDAYSESTQKWCTDMLNERAGHLTVTIPSALPGGYYLLRPEILALHAASNGDPQFYIGCAQIFVQSSGTTSPSDTVSIPGYVKKDQKALSFNLYISPLELPYPALGPKLYQGSSSSRRAKLAVRQNGSKQSEGLKPKDCVCVNANWCGTEVPSYTDEPGCWASAEDCWQKNQECYESAPASGNRGCDAWNKKCHAIADACNSKSFPGPPNKGEDITPEPPSGWKLSGSSYS